MTWILKINNLSYREVPVQLNGSPVVPIRWLMHLENLTAKILTSLSLKKENLTTTTPKKGEKTPCKYLNQDLPKQKSPTKIPNQIPSSIKYLENQCFIRAGSSVPHSAKKHKKPKPQQNNHYLWRTDRFMVIQDRPAGLAETAYIASVSF